MSKNTQGLIFGGLVRSNHPLAILKNKINLTKIKNECTYEESTKGRKGLGLEFHLAAEILKYVYKLSDSQLTQNISDIPAYQYFCGFSSFDPNRIIHSTTFVKFRKRFGESNFDILFKEIVMINDIKVME